MIKIYFILIIILSAIYNPSLGQDIYKIGDKIASFSLTNASDNNNISLSDFKDQKAIAIIFTNTNCPYSKLYEDRLIDLANSYQQKGVRFLFINPDATSKGTVNTAQAMDKRAKAKNFPFPYLMDNNGIVSKIFGATKNPEAFLLKVSNGSFVLLYRGAIDDNPQVSSDVTHSYLQDALNEILANRAVKISYKRPIGCMVSLDN